MSGIAIGWSLYDFHGYGVVLMRLKSGNRTRTALLLIAPFVICYLVVFAYPVYKMFAMSFTDAPLIGEGEWVGLDNYIRMSKTSLSQSVM